MSGEEVVCMSHVWGGACLGRRVVHVSGGAYLGRRVVHVWGGGLCISGEEGCVHIYPPAEYVCEDAGIVVDVDEERLTLEGGKEGGRGEGGRVGEERRGRVGEERRGREEREEREGGRRGREEREGGEGGRRGREW